MGAACVPMMNSAQVYGKRADECVALADKAISKPVKEGWLDLARTWRELQECELRGTKRAN